MMRVNSPYLMNEAFAEERLRAPFREGFSLISIRSIP